VKLTTRLCIALGILIALSPLGRILPDYVKAGFAWGEWDSDEIGKQIGYVPKGMEHVARLWTAPMPDYALRNWEKKGLTQLSLAYVLSAIVGVPLVALVVWLIGRRLTRRNRS
jgi:hypothetical protein